MWCWGLPATRRTTRSEGSSCKMANGWFFCHSSKAMRSISIFWIFPNETQTLTYAYMGIFFTVFSLKLHHMSLLTSRLDASKCKSSREGFCPPRSKRPGADCNILSNQKRPKTTTTFRGCSKYILAVLAHTTTRTARVCVTVSIQLQQQG